MRPFLAFALATLGCAFAEDSPQSPALRIANPAAFTPFLMFEGWARQPMELHTRVIPDSAILDVKRYGPDDPGPEGTVMLASMSLRGQRSNGSPFSSAKAGRP